VSSGVGKLIMTILAAVADMERIRIKERTAEGRKAKKARGGPVGKVPFGYRKVGEGRAALLEVDEKEQEIGVYMNKLYQEGKGLGAISARLAESGLLSRAGTPFTPMSIRRVVTQ
jgi:DNA invertase Pin-like site-specific DNA recombinase